MKYLTVREIVMALRYCVAAQNSASGEACVHCKIMELTGCDKVQACSLLDKLAADYLEAIEADNAKMLRNTGAILRIDKFGWILIPLEVRRNLHIHEDDAFEIIPYKNLIVLRKYKQDTGKENEA